jgi:hypothetical protein
MTLAWDTHPMQASRMTAKTASIPKSQSMMQRLKQSILFALLCPFVFLAPERICAQGTAFTYQGQLYDSGGPANGSYDFAFQLFTSVSNGSAVGPTLTNSATAVSNGLFVVTLDFGPGIFTGPNYWLDISVETNGAGAFYELTPRQAVTPTPYAIYANTATNLSGTLPVAQLSGTPIAAENFDGLLAGDVVGTQGATVVAYVGGQTASNVASGVIAANGATSSNTPGAIVTRDVNGNFCAGSVALSSNLYLPFPAVIYSGTDVLLVDEGSLFIGKPAGGQNAWKSATGNVGIGDNALLSLTGGINNTACGEQALQNATGSFSTNNSALGFQALQAGASGHDNTAVGTFALQMNTASFNTAVGSFALQSNVVDEGTAIGYGALQANTIGNANTAVGCHALRRNIDGRLNTATGVNALEDNTSGNANTAFGIGALGGNVTGNNNTAAGVGALSGFNSSGNDNTATGAYALDRTSTGSYNTANGSGALKYNSTGSNNVATGYQALSNNTTASYNTADGFQALANNAGGDANTAIGGLALYNNSIGIANTASGYAALSSNQYGGYNVAAGAHALGANITGSYNTADGFRALSDNTNGDYNTADGVYALELNTSGSNNTAIGSEALLGNTTGSCNTATGYLALAVNTTGVNNTAVGTEALSNGQTGNENTAIGDSALEYISSGGTNIGIGYKAGYNLDKGNNDIYIGNQGTGCNFDPAESNTIRIGSVDNTSCLTNVASTYIAGIYDAAVPGVPVVVDSCGHLGTCPSSQRYKQNIQDMADASDVLLSLRPVTYQYKPSLDPKGGHQFGLVAEEVDKLDPDLVVHDASHAIFTVRYEAVNAMLLNEFLKQHRKVETQNTEIQSLQQQNGSLADRLNELEAMVKNLAAEK